MNNEQFNELMKKIDSLTKIFAYTQIKNIKETKERIWLLHAFGFTNDDIANILNTTKDTIKTRLSEIKSSKKK